jgi:hypothetical protein
VIVNSESKLVEVRKTEMYSIQVVSAVNQIEMQLTNRIAELRYQPYDSFTKWGTSIRCGVSDRDPHEAFILHEFEQLGCLMKQMESRRRVK